MKKHAYLCLLLFAITTITSNSFANLSKKERISDARAIVDHFSHRYAPMSWKAEILGVNMDAMAIDFLNRVAAVQSDEGFYTEIARYLSVFNDAHVKIQIPSSYRVTLGFDVDYVDGSVVITHVYRHLLSTEDFPYEKGDKLIFIDRTPVERLIYELSKLNTTGSAASDVRVNAANLTWRSQSQFAKIPTGKTSVTVESASTGERSTIELAWNEMGFPLAPTPTTLDPHSKSVDIKYLYDEKPLSRLRKSIVSVRNKSAQMQMMDYDPIFPLWEDFEEIDDAPFPAGTVTIGQMKVGFIRLPTFAHSGSDQNDVIAFLGKYIPIFEDTTDIMIIDMNENEGGYICYSEKIGSFFIQNAIEGTKFKIKPTRTWAISFEWELEWTTDDNDRSILSKSLDEVRESLLTGKDLTDPLPLCSANGKILPATEYGLTTKTYSKPILILVNELNASAGEMFPILLQDAGRAKVFGSQTMGAGGSVTSVGPFGNSDVSVSITESLVWREKQVTTSDGITTNYIENIGVIPDYYYEVTLDDFQGEYEGYLKNLEEALNKTVIRD